MASLKPASEKKLVSVDPVEFGDAQPARFINPASEAITNIRRPNDVFDVPNMAQPLLNATNSPRNKAFQPVSLWETAL
jgi:hypothetical protein